MAPRGDGMGGLVSPNPEIWQKFSLKKPPKDSENFEEKRKTCKCILNNGFE